MMIIVDYSLTFFKSLMLAHIVKGSGGVRKVRWAKSGQGKSGGIRVIYYWKKSDHEIWMLTLYSKSERATISGHVLKQIAEAIEHDKS